MTLRIFEFNKYDCYGNEYICYYENGTNCVYLIEGEEKHLVFEGNYEKCVNFVNNTLLAAQQSIY